MKLVIPINIMVSLTLLLLMWSGHIVSPMSGAVFLLFSLFLSAFIIFQTHKGTENARPKILKEVGVMVLTLIIVLFLGGIAAILANYQVGMRWGEVAGLVSAIGASFLVGYLIRMGMMRFTD